MSLEDNKAVIRRLYDAFNTVDLKAIDEALAADVVDLLPLQGQASGVEGLKERFIRLRKSFPDVSFTIETMIAEGDMIAERSTLRGTHSCLLYTSDAADEEDSVDLGGRRIIKK